MESAILRSYRPLSKRLRLCSPAASIRSFGCIAPQSQGLRHQALRTASPPTHKHTPSSFHIPGSSTRCSATKSFSSARVRQSRVVVNPRKDDDGNDMVVDITPRASSRLHAIAEKDSNPSLCLRVTVESGGCHGFQYLMSLTSMDKVSQEEDTVFESEDGKGARVVMDESSLELLKGSKIDYTMELIGSQFKVTGIPGAKSSCGCGTSFDIQA